MRRLFIIGCMLMSGVMVLTSCLKSDNDDVTLYDDMAITAVTLGTLNRYVHTQDASGGDSVYQTTFTASGYLMSIDQTGHRIFNRDSLPYGTDAGHVVLSAISTRNGGVAYLKSVTGDTLTYLSTSDSIDLSVPRIFRVYATDGSGYRDYTVELNVSRQEATQGLAWTKAATPAGMPAGATVAGTAWWDGRLVAVSTQADGPAQAYATTDGSTWLWLADCGTAAPTVDGFGGTAVKDGCLYVLSDGRLTCHTTDGQTHSRPATQLTRLLGASTTSLYAMDAAQHLLASADGGQTWTEETLDEDAALLPTTGLAMVCFPYGTAALTDYVLLVGHDAGQPRLWRKINEYGAGAAPARWVYMTQADDNPYAMPLLSQPSLVCHDGRVLLVAREGVYVSRDQGITWKAADGYALPDATGDGTLLATQADDGSLWLTAADGQTWHAR